MAAYAYREPYRISSGLLTLLMHALFFALMYLGVNWHVLQPEGMEVELWASLPETEALPPPPAPPAPPVAEQPPQKVEPVKQKEVQKTALPAKAEIGLAQKKKPEPKNKPLTETEKKRLEQEMAALNQADEAAEQSDRAAQEQKAALAAKAHAAITSEMDKYRGLIGAKIRSKIVMPPDVADDAVAEFVVTLLPDGSLLGDPKLVKPSGNSAYDSEVERAIRKAQPLPLPKSEEIRALFINPSQLRLKFSPKDGGSL